MNQNKLKRLNELFEKRLENRANITEKRELNYLYQEFINDGRDENLTHGSYHLQKNVAINY